MLKTWLMSGLGAISLLVAIQACTSKAGDACEKGKGACKDNNTALACNDGKFIEVPCKGAKGCTIANDTLDCDLSGNQVGDICAKDQEGEAQCAADGKSYLVCKSGKFAVTPCRGPGGCKYDGKTSKCDNAVGQEGDGCEGDSYVCSVDGKALLKCDGKNLKVDEKCVDGGTCKAEGTSAGCQGGKPPDEAKPADSAAGEGDEPSEDDF